MTLKTTRINIHYPESRPLDPEDQDANVEIIEGAGEQALKNRDIEDDDVRLALDDDKANVCITIQPGDVLGQVKICTQYEGKKGAHESCLSGQNDLALKVSDWLSSLLGDSEQDWNVVINADPCPKAKGRYRIVDAARRMSNEVRQDQRIEQTANTESAATRKHAAERDVEQRRQ